MHCISYTATTKCNSLILMEALSTRLFALPISDIEVELWFFFRQLRLKSVQITRAPSTYYDWTLEERRAFLKAPSTFHLCKTIVMENTAYNQKFAHEPYYFQYIAVVVQYEAKLSAEKIMKFAKNIQNQRAITNQVSKKGFHFRLADEAIAATLTGYGYNATTPFLMKTDIPILLSEAVANLHPRYFWMGGGEVELKLGMSVDEFLKTTDAYVADIS